MTSFSNSSVESAFLSLPHEHQLAALQLREWIHEEADGMSATGGIEESLKWGQPAFLPVKPKVGSTIRVWRHDEQHVALYFNCQSTLVEDFIFLFADELQYSGNRAIVFSVDTPLPEVLVRQCIRMALYYHRDKKVR